jgi:tagatose 1,6-diphosphate aldolase
MINPNPKTPVSYKQIISVKLYVLKTLSSSVSAVLLDPLYSASQSIAEEVLPASTGLLVAVEQTGYSGTAAARESKLLPDWGVAQIKKMGADAVKLLIYYHPEAGDVTAKQENLVSQIVQDCADHDIAFFLEAVTYSIDPDHDKNSQVFSDGRPDLIARMVDRLSALNPDVLKIEFPVDIYRNQDQQQWAAACQVLSNVSRCPWTVLSAGVNFPIFEQQVTVACQAGASGFIGGRAIWKEGIAMQSAERIVWLENVARERLERLNKIANQSARPWTAMYPRQSLEEYHNWYSSY